MSSPATNTIADPVMLDLFRAELEAHTRVLEEGLVKAEGEQSAENLETLMRAAHSIKGAARMMGLDRAVHLAHAMEDVLAAAQRGITRLTTPHVDALLRSNDVFLRAAKSAPEAIPAALEQQGDVIDRLVAELAGAPAAQVLSAPTLPAAAANTSPAPEPPRVEDQSVRVRAESLNRLVGLAGECVVQTRLTRPLISGVQTIKQNQALAAGRLERVRELLREGKSADGREELERALEQFGKARELIAAHSLQLDDWSRRLEVLLSSLYTEAIASRMRPFSDATHGYPRMVRELAKKLGKEVRFEIDGASTPVDRDILDRLESPLTHLLRNALDHGIELPADRVARGKSAEGKLVLSAHQVAGMLRIAVTDDGAGIDLAAVRRKITQAGHLSEETARNLGDAEILEFLFLPGFSTSDVVTEISGRGVGLDVVHSAVRAVGGSVRIQSTPGAGATVELQLPLTLAVVRSLLVEIGAEAYAIPLTRIDRLVRTTLKELEVVENRQFLLVDEKQVGVLDARQVLGTSTANHSDGLCVAVISDRMSCYGLVVDRFIGLRDLVVKPLPPCLGKVPNISNGAILDDGTPALILDVDDLVRSMDKLLGQGELRKVTASGESIRPRAPRRILVVDDSITVREVERRLLENQGYEVTVAVDGMDGWNTLQRASFDLLVTDVDMPRMDGLELVRRVRSAPRSAALPIVIVSYKEQPEYRLKGMEAGANYYLTKSSFHDESLIGVVRDLIGEA